MSKNDSYINKAAEGAMLASLKAFVATIVGIILTIIGLAILSGCASIKETSEPKTPVVPINHSTNTNTVHIERIDTVFIEIPAQSAERTTPDKFSHLETGYAESDARINEDGTLHHTLKNKPQPQPVQVKNSNDTIYVEKTVEKPVPVEVPVEVERKLTKWEQFRLNTWGWIATALALCIGWICRKPILTFARRLLTKTT